jgi:two-component system, OmpR family, sensor histidine kinase SenX3
LLLTLVVVLAVALAVVSAVALLERRRAHADSAAVRRTSAVSRAIEQPAISSDERLAAALSTITQGVVVADAAGDTIFENDFAAGFLRGRHGDAVVGHTIERLLAEALAGRIGEEELHLYGPPRRTVLLNCQPITGDDGALVGAVALIDDVTEQERIDAMRRDFVANISHELRTPVGAMSLLAETLIGEDDPEVVEHLAARILTEATRVTRTIEDLLELSRIEHGLDQDREAVSIQRVVAEAVDAVRAAADQRRVDVGSVQPDQPLLVLGDRRQLRTAIYNLLDNAVKYVGEGDGVVSVRSRQRDDLIEIQVQDNGIGIPRRDLDRIFERFYRVDRGRSRTSGGTGLGLSIVRHVVANHGGRISVDSVEGEGSTFQIELPAVAGQTNPSTPEPNEAST